MIAEHVIGMPTALTLLIAFVAAINLRLIVPGLLAMLGIWSPPERAPRITG